MNTLILIPSRLSATRLTCKPLIKIVGKPIISRVLNIAKSAMIGEVYVATEDKRIFYHIKKNNGKAILTNIIKTVSYRIYYSYKKLKLRKLLCIAFYKFQEKKYLVYILYVLTLDFVHEVL